jgi:YbbR domain-containing protein
MDRLLRNNTIVKVIALLLSIALWFVVDFQADPKPQVQHSIETYRISEVGLTATVDHDRLSIVEMPQTVNVELKGSSAILNRTQISPEDYELFVDLRNYGKGRHLVPVQYKGFPAQLSVRIIPARVEVILEEKQKIEKEVSIQFIGKIPQGYSTGEAIIKPKKVHVTLPESKMKEIGQVQALVNVDGVMDMISDTVPLRVLDKHGNPMDAEINPTLVEVQVPVTSPYKVLPINLTFVNETPDGFAVADTLLKKDKITVYGPLEVLEGLSFYPGPQIDLSTLTEDRYMELKIPLLPRVIKTEPDFIELEVDIEKATDRTFENLPISINGIGERLQAVFVTPETGLLTVTIQGVPNRMRELSSEDIQLYVDVSNLPPGDHEVPIRINLPNFVKLTDPSEPMRAVIRISRNE